MHKITKREFELLRICWYLGETTTRDVYEESLKIKKRSFTAVKTILEIMARKNLLKKRMIGHTVLYSPFKTKKKFLEKLVDDFVDTALNGSVMPIFINFIKKEKPKKEDLDALRKIIDEIDDRE
jgi:BlaI family transcriptional regulator, penicillinase repressor